jgi:16S rRNA (uracil1498-N3)-methyltransferase
MHRCFINQDLVNTGSLTLTDSSEIHHLRDVLRLKPKETLVLFNGRGKEAEAVIEKISHHEVQFQVLRVRSHAQNPAVILTLACAIPKKAKFETIIGSFES